MKELTIRIQKNSDSPDCNNILIGDDNIGAIAGTLQKGTSEFDIKYGIVYFHNHDVYCGMLWNVTEVIYLPMEVKV